MRTSYQIAKRVGPMLYEEIIIDQAEDYKAGRITNPLQRSIRSLIGATGKLLSISRETFITNFRLIIIRAHKEQEHCVRYEVSRSSQPIAYRYHLSESSIGCKSHVKCRRLFGIPSEWVICRSVPQYDFFAQITGSRDLHYNYPLQITRLTVTLPSGSLCEAPLKRQSKLPIPPKDDKCINLDLLFIPDPDGFFRTSNLKGNSTGAWRDIRKILAHWLQNLPITITLIGSETFCPTWTAKGRLYDTALVEPEAGGKEELDKGVKGPAGASKEETHCWTFDKELLAALDGSGSDVKEIERAKGRLRVVTLEEYILREEARTVFDPEEIREVRKRLARVRPGCDLGENETA